MFIDIIIKKFRKRRYYFVVLKSLKIDQYYKKLQKYFINIFINELSLIIVGYLDINYSHIDEIPKHTFHDH